MENTFAKVIMCQKKGDLARLCKNHVVQRDHFVDFVIACKEGLTHLNHTMHYWDYVPKHLETLESDYEILERSVETQKSTNGKKALRRLFKTHGQRKYKVAHMFFSRELQHPISEWHMLFFEMNELREEGNHWCGGSHIHITNHLWPNLYCQDLWNDFIEKKKFPTSKLHLAFRDERQNDA